MKDIQRLIGGVMRKQSIVNSFKTALVALPLLASCGGNVGTAQVLVDPNGLMLPDCQDGQLIGVNPDKSLTCVSALSGMLAPPTCGANQALTSMKNTVSIRLGGEYDLGVVTLRGGISYETGSFGDAYLSALTLDSDKTSVMGGMSIMRSNASSKTPAKKPVAPKKQPANSNTKPSKPKKQ